MPEELGFGAECARSWVFTNCEGAGFFRAEKLEIGNPQGTGTFSKCFISKSKAKLKLEMKSKWQITLPSSDKVEVKILEIVWQLTLLGINKMRENQRITGIYKITNKNNNKDRLANKIK